MADTTNNLNLTLPGFGEFENSWGTGALNTNFQLIDTKFGAIDGHRHTGQAGDGPAIDHEFLLNRGSLTHVQIEATLTSLQSQINNIELVDVQQIDGNGSTVANSTIIDVNTIQFQNCVVEPGAAAGVVKVTPNIPSSDAYEISAPVNHFDAFVGAANLALSEQSWDLTTTSAQGEFVIQDTGNGLRAVPTYVAWTQTATNPPSGIFASSTGMQYQLAGAVPHSEVQRVGVVVEKAEFEGDSADPAQERITIGAAILSSGRGGSNPIPYRGVRLEVSRVGTQVDAKFVALKAFGEVTHTILGPGQQPWTGKGADYLLGQHEISLSKDSVSERYWLHYYYNKSLIYKYEEPVTNAPGDFWDTVRDIISELEADGSTPDFGQFSFSLSLRDLVSASSAEEAEARPVTVFIDSVMASSIGERSNAKFISSGFGGESGTPGSGGQEVCSSFDPNPYEGYEVGDQFQPVNGGPVMVIIAAGPDYFVAQDASMQQYTFYCTGAGGGNPGTGTGSGDPGGEANVDNNGTNNLQVGEGGQFASTTFVADVDIPENWVEGNLAGATVIAAGDALPADFITGQAVMVEQPGAGEGSAGPVSGRPKFTFATGTRLPLGTKITAVVDPTYDATVVGNDNELTSTFTDLLTVEAVTPSSITTKAFRYHNGAWSLITGTNRAVRGDGLAMTVSGRNLPLDGFWAPGVGFGRDYRVGDNALVDLLFGSETLEGGTEYFSSFELGAPAMEITGPMPSGPIAAGLPSGPRPTSAPSVVTGSNMTQETLVVVGRLSRCPQAGQMRAQFTDGNQAQTSVDLFTGAEFEPLQPVVSVSGTVEENTTGTVQVTITYPNPLVGGTQPFSIPATSTGSQGSTISNVSFGSITDNGAGSTWTVVATLEINAGTAGALILSYNDGCGAAGFEVTVTSGVVVPGDPPAPQAQITETSLYQCEPRDLAFSIPAGNVTAGDVLTITPVGSTCVLSEPQHTFTAAEAAGGYSTTLTAAGVVGATPQIQVQYDRAGANNPTSTQTLSLTLDTPTALTITGTGTYDYEQVVGGVLEVDLNIAASSPWRPGVQEATLSDNSTAGTAQFASQNPIQNLGNGDYRFRLDLGSQANWETGDQVTLTVPNHDTCSADAGSTSFTLTLTVGSEITMVRSGQTLNRFPFNIIVEGATTADAGKSIKLVNFQGGVLQDLGTLAAGDVRPGTRAGVTTEAVLEGILDFPLAAFPNGIGDTINPFLQVGTNTPISLVKSTNQGFIPLQVGYMAPPETLEAAFVGINEYSSPLAGVSEDSTVQILVRNEAFAFIKPEVHEVAGNLSGTIRNPVVTLAATWTFNGGTLNSVVEVTPPAGISPARTRQFNLDLGSLTGTSGTLALELRQVDPTDSQIQTLSVRTYSDLITVAPNSSGGGPLTSGLGVGS